MNTTDETITIQLHSNLSKGLGLKTDIEIILFDRLLWFRNACESPAIPMGTVFADIDGVLSLIANGTLISLEDGTIE
jgi:hypothetical protein